MIAMDLSYDKHETDRFVAKRQERVGGRLASSNLLAAQFFRPQFRLCAQEVTDLVPVQFRANLAWLGLALPFRVRWMKQVRRTVISS
jgi:hypothetical protein